MSSQSKKKIESAVQESTFVAILQEERNGGKKGNNQPRLMMLGFQLTLSGLLILVLILAGASVLRMRWAMTRMPAKQRLGEKEELRSGVNSWMTPEQKSRDLTVDGPQKSNWMMTFDKIRLEAARRTKTTKLLRKKGFLKIQQLRKKQNLEAGCCPPPSPGEF